jgi:hypothetical protein
MILCLRIRVSLLSEETVHYIVGLHILLLFMVAQSRAPELHAVLVIRKVVDEYRSAEVCS